MNENYNYITGHSLNLWIFAYQMER